MFHRHRDLIPLDDRGPLRVMFVTSSMPVGGAETVLAELVRRLDRERFRPQLCCLKSLGPLGDALAQEIPTFAGLSKHKLDVAVLWRLTRLMHLGRVDAVVTLGTGKDAMFYGRLAARLARVPVICSVRHLGGPTGRVGLLNRLLGPITDALIVDGEPDDRSSAIRRRSLARKVCVIPNGVDTHKFHPRWPDRRLQEELDLSPQSPVVGLVGSMDRQECHEQYLQAAALVRDAIPDAQFLVIGEGSRRASIESFARDVLPIDAVRFLGARQDMPEVLSLIDVVLHALPTPTPSIALLEAMAAEKPIVATRPGSGPQAVADDRTGLGITPGDARQIADRVIELLGNADQAGSLARAAREKVLSHWPIARTVEAYQDLIWEIYTAKASGGSRPAPHDRDRTPHTPTADRP